MKYILTLLFSIVFIFSFSQHRQGRGGQTNPEGIIHGYVLEKTTGNPVEYANIIIYSLRDSSIVTGGITDINGAFRIDKINYGGYFIEIQFIGFGKHIIPEIHLNRNNKIINLGKIEIELSAEMLDEVQVDARVERVEYRLDRRIVNVGQDITAAGGTAVDALENVPGVQTDIDDNVSIRGTESFLVLIDGRPSPMQGSEALQQIPAESIETIEIITNPSAKYDPDGVGGIINVMMKKDRRLGYNAQVSANYGSFNSYGSDFLVNIRKERLNFFIGGNYNDRRNKGIGSEIRKSFIGGDTVFIINTENDRQRTRNSGSARIGLDYYLNDNEILTISGRYNLFTFGRDLNSTAQSYWYDGQNEFNPYNYLTDSDFETNWSYFAGDINYMKKFSDNGHELQVYASYSTNFRDQKSLFTEQEIDEDLEPVDNIIDNIRTTDGGGGNRLISKLDYELPLNDNYKIETGYQVRITNRDNEYKYQKLVGSTWIDNDDMHNPYLYSQNIQSGYLLFSSTAQKFKYMLGLRTEYTDRVFELIKTQETMPAYNKFDFFPSLHVSYKFPKDMEVMASYSRRLNRPRPWHLNPVQDIIDPNNVRRGNPLLEPEYTNSMELNFQKRFDNNFISFEVYYRETNNKIERQVAVDPANPDIFISTTENIGESLNTGSEIMTNLRLTKWWDINLSGSVYYYEIKDINNTITWRTRMNNSFRIPKIGTRLQFSGFYNGPSITSQGRREAMYMFNAGIRQDFLDRKLSVNLSIRDVFDTMGHEMIYETENFYSHLIRARRGPTFNISVTYRMNDFKSRREKGLENGGGYGVDDEM